MGLLTSVVGVGPKTVDDHGSEVRVVDSKEVLTGVGTPGYPGKGFANRLKVAVSLQSGRVNLVNLGIVVGGVIVLSFVLGSLGQVLPGVGFGVRLGVFVAGIIVIGIVLRLVARGVVAPNVAATAVSEGLCGSCGYRLMALVPAADGCIVCPECGAAWRACRITRPCWDQPAGSDPFAQVKARSFTRRYNSSVGSDDRGCITFFVNTALRPMSKERRAQVDRATEAALKRSLRRVGRGWRYFWTAGAAVWFLLFAYFGVNSWIEREQQEALALGIVGGLFGIVAIVVWKWGTFGKPSAVKRVMLEQHRCPTCVEVMFPELKDADGCTTCPSCGSSWRLSYGVHSAAP